MYILIPSFPSIYFALYQFYFSDDVTVITNNSSVHKILLELKINCIYLKFDTNVKKVFKVKSVLNKFLKKLDISKDFYLLDNIHSVEGFYIAKEWPKGKVFFKNLSTEFKVCNDNINLKAKLIRSIYKTTLGLDLVYRNSNGTIAMGIDDSFIKKNKINYLELTDYNYLKLKVLEKIKLSTEIYNSILVLQGKLTGIIKPESLSKVFKSITNIESLVIKEHPKHKSNEVLGSLPTIPNYYPVEMCYGNIEANIISVYSLSLIIASQLKNKNAISLLEMVEWYNDDDKKEMKNMLIEKSNDKILFPTTIVELRKILKK